MKKDEDDDPPIYKKGHSTPEVSYWYLFPAQSPSCGTLPVP